MKPLWPSHYMPPHTHCITGGDVLDYVAKRFKITRAEITGTQRGAWFIYARATAVAILLRRGNSTTTTGKIMHRDHTTVLNARDKLPIYMTKCDMIAAVLGEVQ